MHALNRRCWKWDPCESTIFLYLLSCSGTPYAKHRIPQSQYCFEGSSSVSKDLGPPRSPDSSKHNFYLWVYLKGNFMNQILTL